LYYRKTTDLLLHDRSNILVIQYLHVHTIHAPESGGNLFISLQFATIT